MLKFITTNFFVLITGCIIAQHTNDYRLSGTVIPFQKNLSANGFITLKKGGKIISSAVSDSIGHFILAGISRGTYTLSFEIMKGPYFKDTIITVEKNIDNFRFNVHLDCSFIYDEEQAQLDITRDSLKILLVNYDAYQDFFLNAKSELPHVVACSNADKDFEKKYKIKYVDATFKASYTECIELYNKTIFKYLDKIFGREWHTFVRRDAEGIDNDNAAQQ